MADHKELLKAVMAADDLTPGMVHRILGLRATRLVQKWRSDPSLSSSRNPPLGEIERLCMLLDPLGEREDIIGWTVIQARARLKNRYPKRSGGKQVKPAWGWSQNDKLEGYRDVATLPSDPAS